jgi:hypothetical protein
MPSPPLSIIFFVLVAPHLMSNDSICCRNERLLQDPVRLRQITERIPAGRWGAPNDFAGPVVFLSSNASQYVCGELLVVDGVSSIFPSQNVHPSGFASTFSVVTPPRAFPPSHVCSYCDRVLVCDAPNLG